MSEPVSIDLMINGKLEHIEETFIPFRKHIEMLEMNKKIEEQEVLESDWLLEKASFIASLFRDERVTQDTVLDGLPADDANEKMEEIIAQMLGVDPNGFTEIPTA